MFSTPFLSSNKSYFDETDIISANDLNQDTLLCESFISSSLLGDKVILSQLGCYTGVAIWGVEFNVTRKKIKYEVSKYIVLLKTI